MNIVSLLYQTVKKSPGKTAVIFKGKKIEYCSLWQNMQNILNRLKLIGFQKGCKVALFLPDGVEFVLCFYAILMGGGIVVPLASYLKKYEINTIFDNCNPCFVISQSDIWEKATPGQEFNVKVIPVTHLMDMDKDNGACNEKIEHRRSDSLASINYTYNGAGYPLGAELTHGNYLYGLVGLIRHLRLKKQDIFLAPLPMAHIYSLALGNLVPILNGSTLVISDSHFPNTLLKLIENNNVSVLISVPSLFALLNRAKTGYRIDSLRFMISGGEYLPPDLHFNIVKDLEIPLVQGYGLTECMPVICNVPGGPDKPESLGIPGRKDILVKIVNPEMKNLETGKVGEILIKSPTTMKRYHNRPEDTKNIFYNGWLKTGDLGRIDHEGFLFFSGLKKKIYNLSGLKVDPFELELAGKLHPKVKDIKISAETIEGILPKKALAADVLIDDNATLEEKELREFYKSSIALYKVPKYIKLRKQNSSMVM